MLTRRDALYSIAAAGVSLAALRTAAFAAADTVRTAVNFDIPAGACDCHVHVFADSDKYPFAVNRVYTPPVAPVEALLDLQRALRLERVVIVQPSVYGTDNSVTLDALRRIGQNARGVAVIDKATSQTALDDMARDGVRGVRLNLETARQSDPSAAKTIIDTTVAQIASRNWHIQLYTSPSVIAPLRDHLAQLPVPVVFDHFGAAKAAGGPNQPGFDAIVDLVKSGRAYVKISGAYRISDQAPDFADATPMAQALVAANPDRIVWGTDWPHPNSAYGRGRPLSEISPPIAIDDGLLLNQMPKWVSDATTRRKILVDNPARLYGFQGVG
jgi:predicted TIM-barrel fold metal-dependent hydrolase